MSKTKVDHSGFVDKGVSNPVLIILVWGHLFPTKGYRGAGINLADRHESFPGSKTQGYIIGRDSECDLVINHPYVSNRHCLIYRVVCNGQVCVFLRDLSSNGTFVNQKVVGCNEVVELKDEDQIRISVARFLFRRPVTIFRDFTRQYHLVRAPRKEDIRGGFVCQEKTTGERFLMKKRTFSPDSKSDQDTKKKIAAELNLMGLCHRNIIFMKEAFEDNLSSSHITQITEKGQLIDLIVRKSKLSEDETRHIFKQIFDAVKYLHERNIVHRDLKPENILILDEKNSVVLCSFDLSTTITTESFDITLCGTPKYIAPEVLAESQDRKYGRGVDIWSLGVVLYMCLCGFPPFSNELYSRDNPYTLNQQIKSGRFDYPSPYWDSIGDPALDLINSMLVVDPERRFTIEQCLAHPWLTQAASGQEESIKSTPVLKRKPTMLNSGRVVPLSTYIASSKELSDMLARKEEGGKTLLERQRFPAMTPNHGPKKSAAQPTVEEYIGSEYSATSASRSYYDSLPSLEYDPFARLVNSAIDKTMLPQILPDVFPEDLQDDIEFNDRGHEVSTWTCTPSDDVPSDGIPLRIDGHPVVLPVKYTYPLTTMFSSPPDPHPLFISPSAQLSDEDVHHIFSTFPTCLGFYLLVNGFLQVMMPGDFNYEEGIASLPSEFGGLKVSLIPETVCPTAGEASASSPTTTTTSTRTRFERIFGHSSTHSSVASSAGHPYTDAFGISVGSTIRAIVPGSKSKQRFEGKIGVAITPRDDISKKYITIPTHLLTDAVIASKTTSLDSDTWRKDVKVCVASTSAELGEVATVFDQDPKSFPIGFSHDVSLVDISGIPDTPRTIAYAADLTWLGQQEWMDIKYNSSNLVLLDDRSREAKSIGVVDSRCQMVGQGIFRIQQQSRKRSSFLGSLSSGSSSSRAQDPRDDPSTWTTLVARSILYRVQPDYPARGGQSGVPVCVVSESTDGTTPRSVKVAGFASFVQMVSDVQKYDLEGDKLYKRLQEGRVAFYGAFQVPQELREDYQIL